MKRTLLFCLVIFVLVVCVPLLRSTSGDEAPLFGFSADSSRTERQWEEKFKTIPKPENLRDYMQRLSARPHNVGSPYDRDNAEWIAAKFMEFGLETQIENFDVLFPTPKERLIELVDGGPRFQAKMQEPALPEDPTSNQTAEQLPTYNAYSIDGDVTGPLVYVNYGVPEDYEELERRGVSVKGAIVIARYGHAWRGIKPLVAGEHGAVGCIIYSDPRDDGYSGGEIFPKGAWRPKDGVQRGSVQDSAVFMGDPLTPGIGATPDAKRVAIKDAQTLTKIPVLPISYADAQPLLEAISGAVAPRAWRGGLAITYHIGPGPAKVHMKVASNWDIKRLYDVIGKIPGSTYPDEWVIRGNHHDAWVNGAEDPISGQVAMMEEARAMGELVKQGWKPKRTMIYCAWDGEEPGLLGSTEWVETHVEDLKKHAVAYINSDSTGRGYLRLEGSQTLEKFMNDVARDIQDPETKLSVWKRAQLGTIRTAGSDEDRREARTRADLRLDMLGGGSDHAPFNNFAGVAALGIGFGGEDGGGIYHSIYDDFYWYTHFSDTDFTYGRALSQTGGTAMMRLADADLLPFEFGDFADDVQMYVREVKKFATEQQAKVTERNREIEEGAFTATADPKEKYVPPSKEEVPPHLNFAPLDNAVDKLNRSAAEYQKALTAASANGGAAIARASLKEINEMLMQSEHKLTTPEGLPGRFWYKHELYAPGAYTGYAAKAIPAVREALEQKKWKQAEEAAARVAHVLENEAMLISDAATKLNAQTK
ncbi:MAG TPA: transferrin receptor-like dimerization domain-containing protein [Candidatus Dormibacteraeota bacterium]|nr:transferrin receptor-like dimerization domain-containing protein [Candidatus Dormibacteraeota bacterium]